jgi:hypothetical protein
MGCLSHEGHCHSGFRSGIYAEVFLFACIFTKARPRLGGRDDRGKEIPGQAGNTINSFMLPLINPALASA